MKKHALPATPRTLVGRKVKQLRKQGLIPTTIYGKNVKSVSASVTASDFSKVYKETGETGLIELTLDGEVRPVLVDHVQVDPVADTILHIEFHQVDLKEKVMANVPIELVGESSAVTQKLGVLLTVLDEIEVEALPTDLPENIPVDISRLAAVNAEIKVSDLTPPKGVAIHTDPGLTIVKIGALISREAEEQKAAEEAAAAAAKAAELPVEEVVAPTETPEKEPKTPPEKTS